MAKLTCPLCKTEMGFFQFMKAPTPWHLKCGACGHSLKTSGNNILALAVFAILALVAFFVSKNVADHAGEIYIGIVTFAIFVVIFEFIAYKLLPKVGFVLVERDT